MAFFLLNIKASISNGFCSAIGKFQILTALMQSRIHDIHLPETLKCAQEFVLVTYTRTHAHRINHRRGADAVPGSDSEVKSRLRAPPKKMLSQFFFNVASRPQGPYGLLGTGSPGRPPRRSHSSRVQNPHTSSNVASRPLTESVPTTREGQPGTSTSTFTQLLGSGRVLTCHQRPALSPSPTG